MSYVCAGVVKQEVRVGGQSVYASNLERKTKCKTMATQRTMWGASFVDALVTGLFSLTGGAYNITVLIGLAFYVGILVGCWGTWSLSFRAMAFYLFSCFTHSAYMFAVLVILPGRHLPSPGSMQPLPILRLCQQCCLRRFRSFIYMSLTTSVTLCAWRSWRILGTSSSLARLR